MAQHPSLITRIPWRLLISAFWTVVAIGFMLACVLILFWNGLDGGLVYSRADTVTYYFPIANRLADVLREGHLLLWTRTIFGGFPLFADGEAGMLYPPNLIAYLLLPEESAILWLRVARFFMAALFTYCYLVSLRLSRFAAVAGALTYAFGSFTVTQMHHTNVGNTAIWLPLTLCMVELALRSVRRMRWVYATFAGVSVGIQALGLHIQPLLMSGLFLAVYLPFRVLLCPIAWPVKGKTGATRPSRLKLRLATALGALVSLPGRALAPYTERLRQGFVAWNSRPWEWPGGDWPFAHRARDGESLDSLSPPGPRMLEGARKTGSRKLVDRWIVQGRQWVWRLAFHLRDDLPHLLVWARRWGAGFLVKGFHRTVLALLLVGMIPAIAFGLSAVQVIPLVELGMFSFRGAGVNIQFATTYSLPMHNLVNLLFPYFFRYTNRFYWSLWSEWETTLYVGIVGLALAGVALIFVRNRMVLFFGAATVASTLLAMGSYSPYPLYDMLWSLPGFSSLRVPGRFSMLVTFCLAVLAAYGLDWLCRTLRSVRADLPASRWKRLSRSMSVNGFGLYLLALLVAMALVVWWMMGLRLWIEKEPWAVKQWIEQGYLALRSARPWLTSDMVLSFLNYTLDPTNEKTAISLALMLGTFLLLFCWFAYRRLWRVWASLVVVLVAVDLLLFSLDFHPSVPMSQLANPDATAQWLMAQNSDGLTRIYTSRDVRKTEANKLLPFQVADITGYSSLQTTRHLNYMSVLNEYDKPLLDLANIRFVIVPKRLTALPSFEYTSYHPQKPLADGPRSNRGAHVTFYLNPPRKADEVNFIANLRDAVDIPQGAEVADIVVTDTQGERVTLKVRAGIDTGEWAWDRPDVTPLMGHKKARVADKQWVTDKEGRRYEANLYHGELKLDKTRTVASVEYHYNYPRGAGRLYGMMLWENPNTAHQIVGRDRFVPRYEDDEVQILENPSRLPRAFLVPTARIVNRYDMMDTMANGDFDPEKVVLLETADPTRRNPLPDAGIVERKRVEDWLSGNSDQRPGSAEIISYDSTEVEIRTKSTRNAVLFMSDSHYPGWKAQVDGQEEQVYRANYLFRAVLVPAGEHRVRFVFEPESFAIGADISRFTLSTLLIFWGVMLVGVPLSVWTWRRRQEALR